MTSLLAVKAGAVLPLAQSELGRDFFQNRSNPDCAQRNGAFCFDWAIDNFDRYVGPFFRQLEIVAISVSVGFAIALTLALLSHRHRSLVAPLLGFTGVLYTVPSIAFFFLLLPITGFGLDTAVIALSAYTLQIIYRNTVVGLANVPTDAKDAGRGMGMTERQLLWRVEVPLAVPEIVAGLRIATVSTVAIATLAFLAGAGGLGDPLSQQASFTTNIIIVGVLAMGMALALDLMLLLGQRLLVPWRRVSDAMSLPPAFLNSFTGALDFILHERDAVTGGHVQVGGPDYVWHLAWTQLEVSALALALAARGGASHWPRARSPGAGRVLRGRLRQCRPRGAGDRRDLPARGRDRHRPRERRDRAHGPRAPPDPHQHLRRRAPGRSHGRGRGEGHGDEWRPGDRARRAAACRSDDHERGAHRGDQHLRHRDDRPLRRLLHPRRLDHRAQRLWRRGRARGRDRDRGCWRGDRARARRRSAAGDAARA